MPAKRRSEKVRKGNSRLTVYPYTHPVNGKQYWRFAYYDDTRRRYITRKTKDETIVAAEKLLDQQGKGMVWETLGKDAKDFLNTMNELVLPTDRDAVIAFVKARQKSIDVGSAAERFMAFKTAKKGTTTHLANVRRDLESMAAHFSNRAVADIHLDELSEWLDLRTGKAGAGRRHGIRGSLVMFWIWCRKETLVPNEEITLAQRLEIVEVGKGKKRIWTPEKFMELSRKVEVQDRAWIVLQAFGGLRPEEACPQEIRGKARGLHGEDIQWMFNSIRVPEEAAKTRAGSVPLNECLRAWLKWAGITEGMTGPVCPRNPVDARETTRLGKEIFGKEGWPKDALRHSYASYRAALIRDHAKLAVEMRTSVDMLNDYYDNPRAEIEGKIWFSLRPDQPIPENLNDPIYRDFQFIRGWYGESSGESGKLA